jgi:acylphosphatase
MPLKAYRIIVTGRVQGVGFRSSVYNIATRHGVGGHVRNLHNGTVEIIAHVEGEEMLEDFLQLVRAVRGPARVDRMEKTEIEQAPSSDRSFRIAR